MSDASATPIACWCEVPRARQQRASSRKRPSKLDRSPARLGASAWHNARDPFAPAAPRGYVPEPSAHPPGTGHRSRPGGLTAKTGTIRRTKKVAWRGSGGPALPVVKELKKQRWLGGAGEENVTSDRGLGRERQAPHVPTLAAIGAVSFQGSCPVLCLGPELVGITSSLSFAIQARRLSSNHMCPCLPAGWEAAGSKREARPGAPMNGPACMGSPPRLVDGFGIHPVDERRLDLTQ